MDEDLDHVQTLLNQVEPENKKSPQVLESEPLTAGGSHSRSPLLLRTSPPNSISSSDSEDDNENLGNITQITGGMTSLSLSSSQ